MFPRTIQRWKDCSVEALRIFFLGSLSTCDRLAKPMPEELWKAIEGWVVKNPGDELLKKQ